MELICIGGVLTSHIKEVPVEKSEPNYNTMRAEEAIIHSWLMISEICSKYFFEIR